MWLKEGDRNTKYFHSVASSRRRNNGVLRLQDETGRWHETHGNIEKVFLDYFSDLFKSSTPSNMEEIFQVINTRVTPAMNQALDKDVSLEEIQCALNQMNPNKAPRLDGMNALFYKKY